MTDDDVHTDVTQSDHDEAELDEGLGAPSRRKHVPVSHPSTGPADTNNMFEDPNIVRL